MLRIWWFHDSEDRNWLAEQLQLICFQNELKAYGFFWIFDLFRILKNISIDFWALSNLSYFYQLCSLFSVTECRIHFLVNKAPIVLKVLFSTNGWFALVLRVFIRELWFLIICPFLLFCFLVILSQFCACPFGVEKCALKFSMDNQRFYRLRHCSLAKFWMISTYSFHEAPLLFRKWWFTVVADNILKF